MRTGAGFRFATDVSSIAPYDSHEGRIVTDNALRVFLLDDHELVRIGLRTLIDAEGDLLVVGEAATPREALDRIPEARPDVAVVDLHLDSGNGVEVCRELRSRHPGIRCLVVSAYSDERDVSGAILAGAAGYVLKQRGSQDLLEAIRIVARGGTVFDPTLTEGVLDRLRAGSDSDPRLRRLSIQERRILELIADGRTNRQIASELSLAEKTVRNYVSNLLAKLGMHRRSEAAAYAARLKERGELTDPS
jgi:DNA-binding NarL/FixJ family response regulator